ncbi:hypothetical protein Tco_1578688 [Tanacetum coccineum]
MRNRINLHTVRDDSLLCTLKYMSKTKEHQVYGAVIPKEMINEDILNSTAYKTYYTYDSGGKEAKKARKFKKLASLKLMTVPISPKEPRKKPSKSPAGVIIKDTPGVSVSKKKAPAKGKRSKGIKILYDVALSEAALLKKDTKRRKKDFHISQASGLGDVTYFESRVPDEQQRKTSDADEGTDSGDDESNDDDSDDVTKNDDEDDIESDVNEDKEGSDSEKTNSDDDENPSFTLKDYKEEEHDEEHDVDVKSLRAEHEKERKGDAEMTDSDQDVSQEKSYEQVVEDAHVTLTSSQNTKGSKQISSVSSDFETNPETSTIAATTVPPLIQPFSSIPKITTPTPVPTSEPTTTSIAALPDFSSMFGFDQRVSTLEKEMSQFKQADHSTKPLESVKSQIPTIVDDLLSTRIGYATRTTLQSYTKEFEKKAQEERKLYIDIVEKLSTITKSLENVILAKSSSQPKSTYESAESLTEFELKKILLDKLQKNRDDKDQDEDPPAGSKQGLKKQKTSKEAKHPKGSKSKESMSSSSKGTKSQPKSSGKSVQAEEPVFETADTEMPQDQGGNLGNTEDHTNVEASLMDDWFKKPKRPPTLDPDWNATKSIDLRPPQKWISIIA